MELRMIAIIMMFLDFFLMSVLSNNTNLIRVKLKKRKKERKVFVQHCMIDKNAPSLT